MARRGLTVALGVLVAALLTFLLLQLEIPATGPRVRRAHPPDASRPGVVLPARPSPRSQVDEEPPLRGRREAGRGDGRGRRSEVGGARAEGRVGPVEPYSGAGPAVAGVLLSRDGAAPGAMARRGTAEQRAVGRRSERRLPFTGAHVAVLVGLAMALTATGAVLLRFGRAGSR